MKLQFKRFSIFIFSAFSLTFCLSFITSRPVNESRMGIARVAGATIAAHAFKSVYDSLGLSTTGLSKEAYEMTMKGVEELKSEGKLSNDSIVTIVDFSKPSSEKRLFIIDLRNYRVLFNTWVAHGRNSGIETAQSFSNTMSTSLSSIKSLNMLSVLP